tara:strand:+ start:839 stop:1330 length:492 start_codon:yes stop_codon:yes gene_type:complete
MHIKLINKKLRFNNYRIKCSIGKKGISGSKKEGDKTTPKGSFGFKLLLYRKDRIPKIKTKLKKIPIKKNMGWCDDPKSNFYNRLVKFPFNFSAEKLHLSKNIYDLILVLDYNSKPVVKNKGSAIFLHISNKNYSPTKGCVATSKKNLLFILSLIDKKTKLKIF